MTKDKKIAIALQAHEQVMVLDDPDGEMEMMPVRDAIARAKGQTAVLGFTSNLLLRSCGEYVSELFNGVMNITKGDCFLDLSFRKVWPDTVREQMESMLTNRSPNVVMTTDAIRSFDVIAGFDDRITSQLVRFNELMPITNYLLPCFSHEVSTATTHPGALLAILRKLVNPCRFFEFHDDSRMTMQNFEQNIMCYLDEMAFEYRYDKDWSKLLRQSQSSNSRNRWNIRKWFEPRHFLLACLLVTFDKKLENTTFPVFAGNGGELECIGRMLRLLVSEWAGRFYDLSIIDTRLFNGFEKVTIGRYAQYGKP